MNHNLLKLLHLADPALPIGGFAHSAGLETYVQQGIVHNAATAEEFVVNMLFYNIHHTDAALVSLAYDATANNDAQTLLSLDEMCTAVKLPQEMRESSSKLGLRLMKIFEPLYGTGISSLYQQAIQRKSITGNYCIAFGMYAAIMQIEKEAALGGFYYNAAAGFVTNSVKLVPLSQQHGQQILAAVQPLIERLAAQNLVPDEALIGLCCNGFDIRCMQHERLYSRLYMS